MSYQLAGRTVNRIGFGTMQLPGPHVWGPPPDRDAALAVLRAAVALGVNHMDTAHYYGPDVTNELIRAALYPYPDDLVFATKVGARRDADGGWPPALAPDQLTEDVHENLTALGIERIDIVNLRLPDAGTEIPLAELIGPLEQLKQDGEIGGVGISTVTVEQYDEAKRHTDVAQVQNLYSVANRSSDALVERTGADGVPFVPYFPLGAAWTNDNVLGDPVVNAIASARGVTPAQIALAWLLHRGDHVLLIPGTSSRGHLKENMAVADIELDDDETERLNGVSDPGLASGGAAPPA
jgi:aryl-alcohol dehydrogenase-like predicted oxidoreductase